VFPGLDLGIDTGEMLSKVNNFEVIEISSKIGKIKFSGDDTEIEPELNLWYSSTKDDKPIIVEFTFKCKAAKQDKAEKMLLEEYSHSLVLDAGSFYQSLQKDEIVDKQATKTKTKTGILCNVPQLMWTRQKYAYNKPPSYLQDLQLQ